MDIRERLRAVPRSYEDFVNYTAERMEENAGLRDAVVEQMDSNPDANSSDILQVVVDFLGLSKPLEIVDDKEDAGLAVGGMRAAY